ncbi:MAG TPA: hypothetical protein VFR58_04595 [Flavisolibacter sp.]|nr:hypothetical protein [Flavisolibacter sp.]
MTEPEDMIPEQQSGIATNTESSASFESSKDAEHFYEQVRERLLQVNGWHDLAGAATARFWLTDAAGNEVAREARQGDHFKISIPGPGSFTGEGYDWVRIEEIEEKNEAGHRSVAIRVRPSPNPLNADPDVAHFFDPEATSCFMAKLEGNTVIAAVYGRNEKPNTGAVERLTDKIRNAAVAAGAIGGFSKIQWKSLVNGLVSR